LILVGHGLFVPFGGAHYDRRHIVSQERPDAAPAFSPVREWLQLRIIIIKVTP
jgi:hypothetical protein